MSQHHHSVLPEQSLEGKLLSRALDPWFCPMLEVSGGEPSVPTNGLCKPLSHFSHWEHGCPWLSCSLGNALPLLHGLQCLLSSSPEDLQPETLSHCAHLPIKMKFTRVYPVLPSLLSHLLSFSPYPSARTFTIVILNRYCNSFLVWGRGGKPHMQTTNTHPWAGDNGKTCLSPFFHSAIRCTGLCFVCLPSGVRKASWPWPCLPNA